MSWQFGQIHRDQTAFHDKAWKRTDQAVWDERWARLSVPARKQYLAKVKASLLKQSARPLNLTEAFPSEIVGEWRKAHLIRDENSGRKPGFIVVDEALGFTARLRALQRFHLLEDSPGEFEKYVNHCFATYALMEVVDRIVEKQTGLQRHALGGDPVQMFVKRWRWAAWAAAYLDDPLTRPVLAAIESAGGSLPLARLAEHLPDKNPLEVRLTVDQLVNHLVLVEDLDPDTLEIMIGLLPSVRKDRQRVSPTVEDSPLEPRRAAEAVSEGGLWVPDLRAVLLEIVGQPPRLKQDHSLYQKEEGRFQAVLDPLPGWLDPRACDPAMRVNWAISLGNQAKLLLHAKKAGDVLLLDLTAEGRRWLGLSLEEQYAQLYELYRKSNQDGGYWNSTTDAHFLGSTITAIPIKHGREKNRHSGYHQPMTPEERRPLRDALYRLFAELPVGTFFKMDDFLTRATVGVRNPLLLGNDIASVMIRRDMRVVPPLEEFLQETTLILLRSLLQSRLIPLGCVQIARDADEQVVIARRPRLDVYFGKVAVAEEAPEMEATRVIVQPDFSVIVIGLNPTPVADLAPFCERVRGRSSQGSLTFRITRESVLKGLAGGLPPDQVLSRLEKHVSTPLPKNVATEVTGWCNWMRKVAATQAMLLRCPDAPAADRVMGALGKHAERIGDTVVAIAVDGLNSAMRQKLQSQGILVEGEQRRRRK